MVFDFDNHDKDAEEKDFANSDDTWVEEVESMREICVLNGIEPLVERSRSGRGAHVWIFFDKPIAASFVSWYLVWQTMMRWLVFRMLKEMQRKLVR